MENFIRIQGRNLFLLNKDLLGLNEAQLWISPNPESPIDNNDQRVLQERAKEEAKKNMPGHRISGIEAVNLAESEKFLNWFEVDTSNWQAGIYRFNIHSKPYIQAPQGTVLRPIRDGQYSWPNFSDEFLLNLPNEQKQFLYLEKNKAGFCMRIEITEEREIKPAGDGLRWIEQWPELKKETEAHYKEKMEQAQRIK
jgi:hypothetical protein